MTSRKELAALAALLAGRMAGRFNRDAVADDAIKLARYGSAATTNATALCNGWKDQAAFDRKKASIERHADQIAIHYRLRTHHTGDPRGYCLRLLALKGSAVLRGNTWGGDEEGFGV